MAIKLINSQFCHFVGENRCEYICDTDADFANLPDNACVGSTAVSIESGTVKIVNTQGEWVTFGG